MNFILKHLIRLDWKSDIKLYWSLWAAVLNFTTREAQICPWQQSSRTYWHTEMERNIPTKIQIEKKNPNKLQEILLVVEKMLSSNKNNWSLVSEDVEKSLKSIVKVIVSVVLNKVWCICLSCLSVRTGLHTHTTEHTVYTTTTVMSHILTAVTPDDGLSHTQ